MRVRVLFFGILKDVVGGAEESLEVPAEATLASVFEAYCQRFETLRERRPSILFARNREFATPETGLTENDEIAFLPPVSGGSQGREFRIEDAEGHVFGITREPIDSQQLARRLQRPEDGAVVVFEGIVRNNSNAKTTHNGQQAACALSKGRATTHLEYECYEPMAIEQMARIGRELATSFEIGRIGMVHRLGRLEIGEASVAVIATAPHRRAAFEAALEGINRLKREVPIWKKEFFADGAVWVDGEWDERLLTGSLQNVAR